MRNKKHMDVQYSTQFCTISYIHPDVYMRTFHMYEKVHCQLSCRHQKLVDMLYIHTKCFVHFCALSHIFRIMFKCVQNYAQIVNSYAQRFLQIGSGTNLSVIKNKFLQNYVRICAQLCICSSVHLYAQKTH